MKSPHPLLLPRLRRHRGLWALAVAVLLFKLITSSVCLADAPQASSAAWGQASIAQASVAKPSTPDDDGCLLGEVGGCHCACAHNLPVPTGIAWVLPQQDMPAMPIPFFAGAVPAASRSPLRPPIVA